MWIFYSCPGDIKQHMAAHELYEHFSILPTYVLGLTVTRYNRQWRWHKKMKLWLTKDELMQPRVLSPLHEEGYYIVWDTTEWRKQRVSNHHGYCSALRVPLTIIYSAPSHFTTQT